MKAKSSNKSVTFDLTEEAKENTLSTLRMLYLEFCEIVLLQNPNKTNYDLQNISRAKAQITYAMDASEIDTVLTKPSIIEKRSKTKQNSFEKKIEHKVRKVYELMKVH